MVGNGNAERIRSIRLQKQRAAVWRGSTICIFRTGAAPDRERCARGDRDRALTRGVVVQRSVYNNAFALDLRMGIIRIGNLHRALIERHAVDDERTFYSDLIAEHDVRIQGEHRLRLHGDGYFEDNLRVRCNIFEFALNGRRDRIDRDLRARGDHDRAHACRSLGNSDDAPVISLAVLVVRLADPNARLRLPVGCSVIERIGNFCRRSICKRFHAVPASAEYAPKRARNRDRKRKEKNRDRPEF